MRARGDEELGVPTRQRCCWVDWVATTWVPEPLAAAQPQIMQNTQHAGTQIKSPKPSVTVPMAKAPPTITNVIMNAPRTVEYSIPSGPNRKVRTRAAPTDLCRLLAT